MTIPKMAQKSSKARYYTENKDIYDLSKYLLDDNKNLKIAYFDTPLGQMVVIANDLMLYLLQFCDRPEIDLEIQKLRIKTKMAIVPGSSKIISQVKSEISSYFEGQLIEFKTDLCYLGTKFQISVWQVLKNIPHGETRSYRDIAESVGKISASRAIANANSANKFAIIIPCHRVVSVDGDLRGYNAGIDRKKWLIDHEKKVHV